MQPIVTDRVVLSVGLSAEAIKMRFGLWARMGPRNHVAVQIPP